MAMMTYRRLDVDGAEQQMFSGLVIEKIQVTGMKVNWDLPGRALLTAAIKLIVWVHRETAQCEEFIYLSGIHPGCLCNGVTVLAEAYNSLGRDLVAQALHGSEQ